MSSRNFPRYNNETNEEWIKSICSSKGIKLDEVLVSQFAQKIGKDDSLMPQTVLNELLSVITTDDNTLLINLVTINK